MTRSTQSPARQNDLGSSMSKLTQGPNVPRSNDKKGEREIAGRGNSKRAAAALFKSAAASAWETIHVPGKILIAPELFPNMFLSRMSFKGQLWDASKPSLKVRGLHQLWRLADAWHSYPNPPWEGHGLLSCAAAIYFRAASAPDRWFKCPRPHPWEREDPPRTYHGDPTDLAWCIWAGS